MTLHLARVRLGKHDRTAGITYVALSRVRRLEDLLIDYTDFGSARLTSIHLPDYARLADSETELLIKKTKTDHHYKGG